MNITTKYNIGDSHWTIQDNKVKEAIISAIIIEEEVFDYGATVKKKILYKLNTGISISEDKVVIIKQDFLNTL